MDCGEDLIEEFASIQRCEDINNIHDLIYSTSECEEFYEKNCGDFAYYPSYQIISELNYYELDEYNEYNCPNKSHCLIEYDKFYFGRLPPFYWEINNYFHEYYDNITDFFQYSCIKINNYNKMKDVKEEEKN